RCCDFIVRLEDAFAKIVELDRRQFASQLAWRSIKTWPLVRGYLWFALTDPRQEKTVQIPGRPFGRLLSCLSRLHRVGGFLGRRWQQAYQASREFWYQPPSEGDETIAFISRPVYLQKLPDGALFDRVVDPLIYALRPGVRYSKFYITAWPARQRFHYPGYCLS